MIRFRMLCAIAALIALPGTAWAGDTAVLIGVGQFTTLEGSNLPGIGLDVDMMKGVADRLGYSKVVELRDKAATRRAILAELERVLVTDATPGERVLVYFSGHGTRVDMVDAAGHRETHSAVVAADAGFRTDPDGSTSMHGVVVGKEFADLFHRARVRSITLVVDACHSGSIDKNVTLGYPVLGTTRAVRKFLVWPGMPSAATPSFDKSIDTTISKSAEDQARYVSMAAAGDEESALATTSGSMFTVGITQAIAGKSADGTISPEETVRLASDYIAREAARASGEVFHPEVHGTDALVKAPMRLSDTRAGGGPNWREALRVTEGLPRLGLTGLQAAYKDGQEVHMTIAVPVEGYLNVISVGPDDTITLLYPNQNVRDNHVAAGPLSLPAAIPKVNGQEIYFPIAAPYGKTLVAAIVTRDPLDLMTGATDAHSGRALYTPSLAALQRLVAQGNPTRAIALGVRNVDHGMPGTGGSTGGSAGGGVVAAWATAVEAQTCSARGC